MHIVDFKKLFSKLGHNYKRNMLSVSAEQGAESVLEVIAQRYDIWLLLNVHRASMENSKHKLLEQGLIIKAVTSSVKQLEKVELVGERKRPLKKSNEKP